MKLPFITPVNNHQRPSSNPKPLSNFITDRNTASAAVGTVLQAGSNNSNSALCCEEPKSVLELRGSPSPIRQLEYSIPSFSSEPVDHQLQDDDDEDRCLNQLQFQDWDSLMVDLGLREEDSYSSSVITSKDTVTQLGPPRDSQLTAPLTSEQSFPGDSNFAHDVPLFPYLNNNVVEYSSSFDLADDQSFNWKGGLDFVDELIKVAECFEINSLQLAEVLLVRLNQRLKSPTGKPLQRAAFYFKEALQSLLTGSTRTSRPSSTSEVIQAIQANKSFSNISPIPIFLNFAANQAILEAVEGSKIVHVVDFDIGFGGHWASFMKALSDNVKVPPVLRITAVVPEEYEKESNLIREILTHFASELKLRLDMDFVLMSTFEYLHFKAVRLVEGETTAVILSPRIFRRIGACFVQDLCRISPRVVVHVDCEGSMGTLSSTFRQCVVEGLEFYSTVLESLEAASLYGGRRRSGGEDVGGDDLIWKIEVFVLFPKILEAVEAAGRLVTPWRQAIADAGLRRVGLSQFADFQAECLLRMEHVKGFHVEKQHGEMVLCWHGRPLVATSSWKC